MILPLRFPIMLCALAITVTPNPGQEPKTASPVVVSEVVQRQLAGGQTVVGTVVPARRSVVGSAVDGRVIQYSIEPGQAIKKGQALVQLRTTQLQISLRAAQAELASRQAMLAELKNGSRPEEIEQATGELDAAAAVLSSSKSNYQRASNLHKRGALTDQQLQDAQAAFERSHATHSAAKAKHRLLKNGARPEQIAGQEAQVAFQQQQVSLLEEQISRHTVTAPFDGYVAREMTEVGEWLGRGDPIAEIIQLSEVEIEVFVLEKHLANVRVGQSIQISVPAVPSEFFTGQVQTIVPQADLRSRSFPVRIRVRNGADANGPVLKSGMLARAQMPLGDRRERVMLDKDAIVFGGREPVVYVLDGKAAAGAEAKVRAVTVQLGVMDGDLIEVTGAVQVGDHVVIRGNERLRSGEQIRVTQIRKQRRTSVATPTKEPTPAAKNHKNTPGSNGIRS